MTDKRLTVLASMQDHYDGLFKRLHYLFAGHGTGLVSSLAVLKDYISIPQYHGVGLLIALFGIGLVCTILSYITLSYSQTLAKNAVLDRTAHEPSMLVFYIHYGGLFASVLTFVVAVCIIVWWFAGF